MKNREVIGAPKPIGVDALREKGYFVAPGFVTPDRLAVINQISREQLAARAPPLEFEADLKYPGAPQSRDGIGGGTIRRLLGAYDRDRHFAECATAPDVRRWLEAYFDEPVVMSRAHHNCLMTKHPRFGSLTGWHRDIRYWSFEHEELVSVWIALGEETVENGALWFVPGSHRMEFAAQHFDEAKFFRGDRADNEAIIRSAESPRLTPGDAVFFHCNTLHSAGRNSSDAVKYSLVFTYHGRDNAATPGTRSASLAEIPLS